MKKLLPLLALVLTAAMLAGCAHYRVGDGNKPAFHTIAFAPVTNHSYAPQIQPLVSDALFQSFARGGGMAIESQEKGAEAVLHVDIIDFRKMIGATKTSDTGAARSLVLVLKANVALADAKGQVLYRQDFEVTQESYADTGMVRAEEQALPELAMALGQKIYRAVKSTW